MSNQESNITEEILLSPVKSHVNSNVFHTDLFSLNTNTSSDWKPQGLVEEKLFQSTNNTKIQQDSFLMTNYFINKNPKDFIGLPIKTFWVIDTLCEHTKIHPDNIKRI